MRTFNFTLVAATLGYVVVIGASPLGVRAPANPRDPPYCSKYPDGPDCSTACRVNFLQPRCEELCKIPALGCLGDSQPTFCLDNLGEDCTKGCDVDPYQQSCVDLCKKDPELSFCGGSSGSGATPPAGPAPAKDVRRQYPDCDQYPDAPGCGPDVCDVYPELCGPSNSD